MCLEENRSEVVTMGAVGRIDYIKHLANSHGLVIDLVPEDVRQFLENIKKESGKENQRFEQNREEESKKEVSVQHWKEETTDEVNLLNMEEEATDEKIVQHEEEIADEINVEPVTEDELKEGENNYNRESYLEELSSSLIVDEDISFSFKSKAPKQSFDVEEFKHELGAVRPMNDENDEQDTDQTLEEESSNEDATISCHLCIQSRIFDKPKELLWHLSFYHFSQEILLVHPFTDGEENLCELCLHQDPNLEYILDSLSVHLNHLGVYHGVVLQFLPEQVWGSLRANSKFGLCYTPWYV